MEAGNVSDVADRAIDAGLDAGLGSARPGTSAAMDVRRGNALRQVWLSVGDYVLNIGLLVLFAANGTIPYAVPLAIMVYATLANGFYLGLIYSGFSQRFRDPFMTRLGVGLAIGANLIGLLLAPQIAFMFIINLFVPLAFAALRFSRREFLGCSLFLLLFLGAMMAAGLINVPGTAFGPSERLLGWAVISIAIARFVVIQMEIAKLGNKLRRRNEELRQATARLIEQASHDELTGLCNRREFMRLLHLEIDRSTRAHTSFCVVLVDIDHFKQVNDYFGHPVGDRVLRAVAQIYKQSVRASDTCARFGGEEFTVLALSEDLDGVVTMIERLRTNVEGYDWTSIKPGLRVTVSAGIAKWRASESEADLLKRADDAMYEAKEAGRNRVHLSRADSILAA